MNIVFDFDGVLSAEGPMNIVTNALIIRRLSNRKGYQLHVCSWNPFVKKLLKDMRISHYFVSVNSTLDNKERFIRNELMAKCTNDNPWLFFDDNEIHRPVGDGINFVLVNPAIGITEEIVDEAIALIKE